MLAFIKGLIVQQESDRTKTLSIQVDPAAVTGTETVLKSKQTVARSLDLPDASGELVEKDYAQILTNKEVDADLNTILNLENDNIKAGAEIDATKIADGSVDNTEFQALDGIEANIQAQLDTKTTVTGLIDNRLVKADGTQDLQATGITVDDSNNMTGVASLSVSGIDNNGALITDIADPVSAQDAASKAYVDAQVVAAGANTQLDNLVGPVQPNLSMDFQGANTVTGLSAPVNPSDAATKAYVDALPPPSSRIVTGSSNSPISVGDATFIPVTSSLDEDIYLEGIGTEVNWEEFKIDSVESIALVDIAYSDDKNIFVAVGDDGTGACVFVSEDGKHWQNTNYTSPDPIYTFFRLLYSKKLKAFVTSAIDGSTGNNAIGISSNGYNWSFYNIDTNYQARGLVYSEEIERFVAVGFPNESWYSDDGKTWILGGTIGDLNVVDDVIYGNNLFVAIKSTAGVPTIYTSPDSLLWTARTTPNITNLSALIYSDLLDLFIVYSSSSDEYATSPDGINWTLQTFPSSFTPNCMAWSEDKKVFLAIDGDVLYSSDGINWSSFVSSQTGVYNRVKYLNESFYSVGTDLVSNIAYTPFILSEISANPQIEAGSLDGQRLTLIGANSADPLLISDGNGLKLKNNITLKENTIVSLRWNDDLTLWVQE